MIRNIIFDMVGVVIRFDTEKYYNDHIIRVPDRELLKFDDTMISADEGLVKPDPAFFRLACDRFRIRPEESVFIDDTPMNVEAAEYVGMSGFLFHGDIRELRDWLKGTEWLRTTNPECAYPVCRGR